MLAYVACFSLERGVGVGYSQLACKDSSWPKYYWWWQYCAYHRHHYCCQHNPSKYVQQSSQPIYHRFKTVDDRHTQGNLWTYPPRNHSVMQIKYNERGIYVLLPKIRILMMGWYWERLIWIQKYVHLHDVVLFFFTEFLCFDIEHT